MASRATLARLYCVFIGSTTLFLALASFAQQPQSLPEHNACQNPTGPPPCKDSDGDGLCDSWEHAKRLPDGTPLPDADPDKPDIYVQYDWMGYGDTENACSTDASCSALGLGHAGETCSGPAVPGSAHSCSYSCTSDSACTSRGASHVGDRCLQNRCMHTHDPLVVSPQALDAVVEKFAEHEINLHLVRGHELPHSHVLSYRRLNDTRYPSNTMSDSCEGGSMGSGAAGAGKYAESFYDLKATSFDPRFAPAYHYMIFGHYVSCDSDSRCTACPAALNPDGTIKNQPTTGMSGLSEISGNDFTVALGNQINDLGFAPDIFNLGGTFMHELGHNLGLHHGGGIDISCNTDADCNSVGGGSCTTVPDRGGSFCLKSEDKPDRKPNYLSVMDYLYQFQGITRGDAIGSSTPAACSADADCLAGEHCRKSGVGGVCARLDYSTQTLPTGGNTPGALDENGNLNELAGLGSGNADLFEFRNGNCDAAQFGPTQGPVDFDGDGFATNTSATADLDSFKHACGTVLTILKGHTDWGPASGNPHFTYKFQCTPFGKD